MNWTLNCGRIPMEILNFTGEDLILFVHSESEVDQYADLAAFFSIGVCTILNRPNRARKILSRMRKYQCFAKLRLEFPLKHKVVDMLLKLNVKELVLDFLKDKLDNTTWNAQLKCINRLKRSMNIHVEDERTEREFLDFRKEESNGFVEQYRSSALLKWNVDEYKHFGWKMFNKDKFDHDHRFMAFTNLVVTEHRKENPLSRELLTFEELVSNSYSCDRYYMEGRQYEEDSDCEFCPYKKGFHTYTNYNNYLQESLASLDEVKARYGVSDVKKLLPMGSCKNVHQIQHFTWQHSDPKSYDNIITFIETDDSFYCINMWSSTEVRDEYIGTNKDPNRRSCWGHYQKERKCNKNDNNMAKRSNPEYI